MCVAKKKPYVIFISYSISCLTKSFVTNRISPGASKQASKYSTVFLRAKTLSAYIKYAANQLSFWRYSLRRFYIRRNYGNTRYQKVFILAFDTTLNIRKEILHHVRPFSTVDIKDVTAPNGSPNQYSINI